jgi:hypothetical protein
VTALLLFKDSQSDGGGVATELLEKTERETVKREAVLCKFCYSIITHTDNLIAVNGSPSHIFANPHGYVFEIECYKRAPGCLAILKPSAEFSWFSGYNWQVAICKTCSNHLGWYFQSKDSSFFGLLQKDLIAL